MITLLFTALLSTVSPLAFGETSPLASSGTAHAASFCHVQALAYFGDDTDEYFPSNEVAFSGPSMDFYTVFHRDNETITLELRSHAGSAAHAVTFHNDDNVGLTYALTCERGQRIVNVPPHESRRLRIP